MGRYLRNQLKEKIVCVICCLSAVFCVLAILMICWFLFVNGLPAIANIGPANFILGKMWKPGNDLYGIFPMIAGSIYITFGAMIVGLPLGLFTAVYMMAFCPPNIYKILKPLIQLLAGIPSVVYGFFGLVVIVPLVGQLLGNSGKNMVTASILLGIMILPTMISVAEAALKAVPEQYYEGAIALGADHVRSIFFVIVPAAKSGIVTAMMLSLGRAIGETMAVIMVAGNQARLPANWTQGVRTMTANIVLEMGYAADEHRSALIATAVILLIFILITHLSFAVWSGRKKV